MKTKPMDHQVTGTMLLAKHPEFYGLGAEQGTGKTWMLLADIERAVANKEINAVVVIAPKGVHTNWVRREIPKHMELEVDALVWVSGPGVRQKREMARLLQPQHDLAFLAMNIDAVNTPLGYNYLRNFLRVHKCMLIIDESSKIKNPDSGRTKRILGLAPLARSRRIASGTMMPNGPPDLFSQMEFLAPKRGLLGTKSYRAFVAEFAQVMNQKHPLMRHILDGIKKRRGIAPDKELPEFLVPQMIVKDSNGMPCWRNLDRLQELIKPHIFRVLKKDCLDLPDKIYQIYGYALPPTQQKVYDAAEKKLRYERDTGQVDAFTALTKITKLRQIVSCFIMLDGEATTLMEKNPRMDLFVDVVEDLTEPFIVWASFREEIEQLAITLKKMGIAAVQYHGGVGTKDREAAVDDFQNGKAQAFIGQPQSGGIGLTLTAATTAIYYSTDYNSETRMQSEDRCHRIGTTGSVTYIDLVAEGTIDERIAAALQRKEEVSSRVLNYL